MSKRFLGSGWPFPIDVDDATGRVPYITEEKKVQQSAVIILGTARGERVMRPDFGSRLHELVFAPMNASTKALVARYATDALVTWEPRIEVLSVSSEEDPGARGKLLVNVEYRVRSTNSLFNLVYPFYLKGGKS
jgi:phage baseplate assembly protein W